MSKLYISLLFVLCLITLNAFAQSLNVTQLIQAMGYPVEQHFATTDDGYILSLQRIPSGRSTLSKSIPQSQKRVVFLQHGLLDCSATWVNNFPYQSLGFILADQGYDVWMGNARGNEYSNRNIYHTTSDKQFWKFSWDEMASYDLVTQVNYALKVSGQQKLAYVGHSQGTTMGFACFSSTAKEGMKYPHLCSQEFSKKISLFVALAPVTYVSHVNSDFMQALAKLRVGELLELIGVEQFLPTNEILQKLVPGLCQNSILQKAVCMNVYCLVSGCDTLVNHVNMTRLGVYFSRLPAGTSTHNMVHWAQMIRANKFQMFDYGLDNYENYHQVTTPQYSLQNLNVDVALYHGGYDILGDPTDFNFYLPQIPKNRIKSLQYYPSYGHIDFIWGVNAHIDVYQDILQRIKESFN